MSSNEKDWIGNARSTFSTIGASNHVSHNRAEHDYYATNGNSLRLLLNRLFNDNIHLNQHIWECAVGGGHLAEVLLEYGYDVLCSDIVHHGYNTLIHDFIKDEVVSNCLNITILTNPPYKYASEFVEKALSIVNVGQYVIMFLKVLFLEGISRYSLFNYSPPKYVYVHSKRQTCAANGDFDKLNKSSGAIAYAWFVWEKGYLGEPIIRWLK